MVVAKSTKANKSKASAKHSKSKYCGGASQCLLDVIATLMTEPKFLPSNFIPREKIDAYMKLQGISGASTIRNAVAKSKKDDLIVVEGKTVALTEKGMKNSNRLADMSTNSNEEYQKKKIDDAKLNTKMRILLDYLKNGKAHSKTELLAELDMTANSTWRNMIAKLKNEGFIKVETNMIELSDIMFPLGRE
jgi:biotin operon repressor